MFFVDKDLINLLVSNNLQGTFRQLETKIGFLENRDEMIYDCEYNATKAISEETFIVTFLSTYLSENGHEHKETQKRFQ